MAMIKKDGNYMGLPMNIARGNPIPLDKSEIWYSYDEMINYAQTSAVAYVGQILGLVNEEDNIATAYIILNINGDVQEVGKATIVDNTTIVLNEETLSLKNFGKRFYKYIPEEEGKAAFYQLVEVDENNPWRAGLEPKVVSENGKFVLGWYEPNPTTMEGVNTQISSIQDAVDRLETTTNDLSENLTNNYYTKTQTEEKIAAAAHLKRVKVDSVEDIDPTAADADQYIYMVPSGLEAEDNKYYEYMVVEVDGLKQIERVGSWEVDLNDYVTKSTFEQTQTNINTSFEELTKKLDSVEQEAKKNFISSVDEDSFNVDDSGQLSLISIPIDIDLATNQSLLNIFVQKKTGYDLISDVNITKLESIEENAEYNRIHSVDENEFIVEDRKLSIKNIAGNKINLTENNLFVTAQNNISSAQDDIEEIQKNITNLNASIQNIQTNYVLIDTHEKDMLEIWERLTWHEL